MGAESALTVSTVLGFFLTLIRVSGVCVFVPVPGLKSAVDPARIVLSLAVTLALFPAWPHPASDVSAGMFALWILSEAAFGIGIGLAVSFAIEAFMVGAQIIGLQAGYSFSSTIDPFTQADSTALVLFTQTIAAALFFATGLDREVIRIFAGSLHAYPPGTFTLTRAAAQLVVLAGSTMFSTGFRLALPVMAIMVMVDIALALLGRVNAQLHLVSIAFPIKMLVGLGLLIWLVTLWPALLRGVSAFTFATAHSFAGH
jgi:flagellar biosynthetic protein FliR